MLQNPPRTHAPRATHPSASDAKSSGKISSVNCQLVVRNLPACGYAPTGLLQASITPPSAGASSTSVYMMQIIDKYESGTSSRASARVFSAIQSTTAPSSRRLQLKPAQAGSPSPPQSPRRRSPAPRPAVSPGRSGPARPPPAPSSWPVPVPPAAAARCRGGRESRDRACYVDLALHRVLSGLVRQLHGERVQLAEAVPEASRFQDVS